MFACEARDISICPLDSRTYPSRCVVSRAQLDARNPTLATVVSRIPDCTVYFQILFERILIHLSFTPTQCRYLETSNRCSNRTQIVERKSLVRNRVSSCRSTVVCHNCCSLNKRIFTRQPVNAFQHIVQSAAI